MLQELLSVMEVMLLLLHMLLLLWEFLALPQLQLELLLR
jgi:hypothetical protein